MRARAPENTIVKLRNFQGGGLWVQACSGPRVVLVAFTVKGFQKLSVRDREDLSRSDDMPQGAHRCPGLSGPIGVQESQGSDSVVTVDNSGSSATRDDGSPITPRDLLWHGGAVGRCSEDRSRESTASLARNPEGTRNLVGSALRNFLGVQLLPSSGDTLRGGESCLKPHVAYYMVRMLRKCDASHVHRPWGLVRSPTHVGFATAEETAYPAAFCDAAARDLQLIMRAKGFACDDLHATGTAAASAFAQKQPRKGRGQVGPPEFRRYVRVRVPLDVTLPEKVPATTPSYLAQ
ncbi:unnamed protein product, partial [Symbiodinium necroappetens]